MLALEKNILFVESSSDSSLITRNVVWNLVGTLIPLFVAIIAFPVLIRGLGEIRFGILGISWAIVGYFSLFDLGLIQVLLIFSYLLRPIVGCYFVMLK